MDKKFVYYSDFGAVGDGVTNDFEAIREAHIYANENHLPVKERWFLKFFLIIQFLKYILF